MKKFITTTTIFLALVCFCPFLSIAQKSAKDSLSMSAKIDSIFELQKKMYKEQRNEPLANKKFGVELNFFRLLILDDATSFSGTFSLFNVNRNAEIAFPVYYGKPNNSKDLRSLTIDCHFRYFLGNTQNGFYISGFARYAHLNGYLGDNSLFQSGSVNIPGSEDKIGIGFGLGCRIFSYKGFYWGFSASFGRYIIGENNKFYGSFLALDDDEKYILDFELLKFGWAF